MSDWQWDIIDEGRVKRAKAVKFTEMDLTPGRERGKASGSGSEDYAVTLTSCTCKDFALSKTRGENIPCKHIIALAMKAGILSENGLTPDQQREHDRRLLRDRLAWAYGCYYLFDDPMVSDAEYDRMKAKLAEMENEK